MWKAVADSILSLAFPVHCRVCGLGVEYFFNGIACADCWSKTRIFGHCEILCSKCGAFLSESGNSIDSMCHKCDDHLYDKASAIGAYEHALAASVIELKHTPNLSANLKNNLFEAFDRSPFGDTSLIVSVPLSAKKMIERGFNQADLIASELSKTTGIPADLFSLNRKIHTPVHRAAMDRKARELTVKNAFGVTRPKLIAGQKILLVDDIFTSGATASYCAKALKKSGAVKVNVLTLARAV